MRSAPDDAMEVRNAAIGRGRGSKVAEGETMAAMRGKGVKAGDTTGRAVRLPPTPCRVCFRPCVFNKFSHFWPKKMLLFSSADGALQTPVFGQIAVAVSARSHLAQRKREVPLPHQDGANKVPAASGRMLLVCGHAGLLPAGSDVLSRRAALGAAAAALASRGQPAAASSRPAEAQAQPFSASASAERLLLDGSASLVDSSQEYDRARSLLYDTRSGSFLPPDPRRAACPRPHPFATCVPAQGSHRPLVSRTTTHHPPPTTHHAPPTTHCLLGATSPVRCAGGRPSSARRASPNPEPRTRARARTRCTPC